MNSDSSEDNKKEYDNQGAVLRHRPFSMWQNAMKENEAHKDVNSRHKIVLLEVEEI